MSKPILCLDFDGVIHSYTSGWIAADFIPDPPVPGAIEFLWQASRDFEINIYSSRSHQDGGIRAMQLWLGFWAKKFLSPDQIKLLENEIKFPDHKPPALVTIDDRAITFTGMFPDVETLKKFKPWNKK